LENSGSQLIPAVRLKEEETGLRHLGTCLEMARKHFTLVMAKISQVRKYPPLPALGLERPSGSLLRAHFDLENGNISGTEVSDAETDPIDQKISGWKERLKEMKGTCMMEKMILERHGGRGPDTEKEDPLAEDEGEEAKLMPENLEQEPLVQPFRPMSGVGPKGAAPTVAVSSSWSSKPARSGLAGLTYELRQPRARKSKSDVSNLGGSEGDEDEDGGEKMSTTGATGALRKYILHGRAMFRQPLPHICRYLQGCMEELGVEKGQLWLMTGAL